MGAAEFRLHLWCVVWCVYLSVVYIAIGAASLFAVLQSVVVTYNRWMRGLLAFALHHARPARWSLPPWLLTPWDYIPQWCGRGSCYDAKLNGDVVEHHKARGQIVVSRFDHEGLCQSQNSLYFLGFLLIWTAVTPQHCSVTIMYWVCASPTTKLISHALGEACLPYHDLTLLCFFTHHGNSN